MKKRQPAAFMSYVRFDDEHDNSRLTAFRKRLSEEVRLQTGEEFPIFQDRNDIHWGEAWNERINTSIDCVTFFICIITPSFFKSTACLSELERFLKREKSLKRNDLVLPVYYVDCPLIEDGVKTKNQRLAKAIKAITSHNYTDWRNLRFQPLTSNQVRHAFAQLAVQIRDALKRTKKTGKNRTKRTNSTLKLFPLVGSSQTSPGSQFPKHLVRPPQDAEFSKEMLKIKKWLSFRIVPKTYIVNPKRGRFHTIMDAIKEANHGERILIRPGYYNESLIIDKTLDIIGDGEPDEIQIQAIGKDAILFKATRGGVKNLTLKQSGDGAWYGIRILQGRLDLEYCNITSEGYACVGIYAGADPRLRENMIHKGRRYGIIVDENGQGTIEDNEICYNGTAGVFIRKDGNPTLRRNYIRHNVQSGVIVINKGQGIFEENDFFRNSYAGLEITTSGNPTLRRNRIYDSHEFGILVFENGNGIIEDNEILRNGIGLKVVSGGNPILRRNRICDSEKSGALFQANAAGFLDENSICNNKNSGVELCSDSNPTLRNNFINKNRHFGLLVYDGGRGTIENNDLRGNDRGPWCIAPNCESKLIRSRNLE